MTATCKTVHNMISDIPLWVLCLCVGSDLRSEMGVLGCFRVMRLAVAVQIRFLNACVSIFPNKRCLTISVFLEKCVSLRQ